MRPREETISVGGIRVQAWVGGRGAPLLVLHGAGGNRGWRRWMDLVSERYTVWAPTHPGFGHEELRREDIGAGGIVKDPSLHKKAIVSVETAAKSGGLTILGVLPSRLTGAEGNQEFFLHARKIL